MIRPPAPRDFTIPTPHPWQATQLGGGARVSSAVTEIEAVGDRLSMRRRVLIVALELGGDLLDVQAQATDLRRHRTVSWLTGNQPG
ncbi:MAG: hypothetical protein ACLP01_20685 [Solirubrobacteraceae bacterium]